MGLCKKCVHGRTLHFIDLWRLEFIRMIGQLETLDLAAGEYVFRQKGGRRFAFPPYKIPITFACIFPGSSRRVEKRSAFHHVRFKFRLFTSSNPSDANDPYRNAY